MLDGSTRTYISNLPVGPAPTEDGLESVGVETVNVDQLPDGLVTGSNLIQFPPDINPEIKSSVALSLLAAQRVASVDNTVQSPEQWMERHNSVLTNLNWLNDGGGVVKSHFKDLNVAVHEAIIPFLMAAFGGAVGAGALIITAVKQLKEMDKNSPWITLFDQQSRRFDVTEYQFSVVQVVDKQVHLKLATARFDASFGKTQVLFFKVSKQAADFESASSSFSAEADLLSEMNGDLKAKLGGFTKSFIQSLPDDLLKTAPTPAPLAATATK